MPSGSGKSTLIRCINRLDETAQKGAASLVDGVDLGAGRRNVDSVRREVGMVFQLVQTSFPHLTALQNCTARADALARHEQGGSRSDGDEVT